LPLHLFVNWHVFAIYNILVLTVSIIATGSSCWGQGATVFHPSIQWSHDGSCRQTWWTRQPKMATLYVTKRAAAGGLSVGNPGRLSESPQSNVIHSYWLWEVCALRMAWDKVIFSDEAACAGHCKLDN